MNRFILLISIPFNLIFITNTGCDAAAAGPATPAENYFYNRPGPWDDPELRSLKSANAVWRQRMIEQQPVYFEQNKIGHAPKILWIGCSDARVPANEMIGEPAGNAMR